MKKTIAVDVDGTLAQYDGWKGIDHIGDPIPGAKEFLEELHKDYNILIWTTRCNPELNGRSGYGPNILKQIVKDWLDKHGLIYDDIWIGPCKPIAFAFVDDRAILTRPQRSENPREVYAQTLQTLKDIENV